MTSTETLTPTNQEVGDRIGLSHSGVSRIRSGDRLPSVPVMARVATEYDWSLADQVSARELGSYAEEFEKAIRHVAPEA